jgi:hypothetical protein
MRIVTVVVSCFFALFIYSCNGDGKSACDNYWDVCRSDARDQMFSYANEFPGWDGNQDYDGWLEGCPDFINTFFISGGENCLASADDCDGIDTCYYEYYEC